MAESINCDICSKLATVHLTQIVNGKIHKIDLCETCAKEKGVTDPNGFSLADLLSSGIDGEDMDPSTSDLVCQDCGFTPEDYKKIGRLGCPSCYENLAPMIAPMLTHMHKGIQHIGKVPHNSLARLESQFELSEINEKLQLAVEEERYEDAARLRDQLLQLNQESEGAHVH
ncbi:MAG: UvrB/UvrC motif-containing protein [Verrucomicrobia bacterium]|nr:UvrB/UvrC motif-containing protein [Verrucomicrobiota bacterium]MDA1065496.1 UvrB/UvrC motif-containing protein [Verrucomicrobiota bacterium]